MSLDKMLNRKKKSVSPPEPEQASGVTPRQEQNPNQEAPQGEPIGSAAMIPEERIEALKEIAQAFQGQQTGRGFSMNDILKMDDTSKGLPEILGVPIGAQEGDIYRMLERCRLTKHEMQVYTNAIHIAEHGFGYSYKGVNLDFPVPFYGEYNVKKLRGSVSVDGESLATFERTVSTWVARLYATAQQQQVQQQRGILQ